MRPRFWNLSLQQNSQGHWNSSKLVKWGDGLEKQFCMLRDFQENWQFWLSQFCCMASDSNSHFFPTRTFDARQFSAAPSDLKNVVNSKYGHLALHSVQMLLTDYLRDGAAACSCLGNKRQKNCFLEGEWKCWALYLSHSRKRAQLPAPPRISNNGFQERKWRNHIALYMLQDKV